LVYLLDANVLIVANRQYYPIDRVPAFWDWLLRQGAAGNVKIVEEVFDEFTGGNDALTEWAKQQAVEDALLFPESVDVSLLRWVISDGYAPDLTDDEVEQLGRDPFLVAYALRNPRERVVVTLEVSKPSRQRANRHVPDVCRAIGVQCIDTFEMISALDFRI
jgi:hypothetical protein